MSDISRRSFAFGMASAAASGLSLKTLAQSGSPDVAEAVSIIDASVDTSDYVTLLERAGVEVVARYFARGCQPSKSLQRKRIAFNPPQSTAEECGSNRIDHRAPEYELLLAKFALLSVYQYNNDNPAKFAFGLPEARSRVENAIRRGKPRHLAGPHVEAEEDAKAALIQSERVKQPASAPIYFGVDFDMVPFGTVRDLRGNNEVDAKLAIDSCLEYFRILKQELGDRLGVYGNGYVNRVLRQEGLVRFSWVSESRSFFETAKFLREGFNRDGKKGEWHLFQHLIDSRWVAGDCGEVLELDGNMHNPIYDYFGAWTADGLWYPNKDRSKAILRSRRVAKRNSPVFERPRMDANCGVRAKCGREFKIAEYHRSVRVHGHEIGPAGAKWLWVDLDDDGRPEGYCLADDFVDGVMQMPDYKRDEHKQLPKGCGGS